MARAYKSARRAAQAASTRQDVLDAAKSLFERHGYGATTMDMIADLAKMSTGTIYTSFKTKPAVLKAILDTFDHALNGAVTGDNAQAWMSEPKELLNHIVRRMVDLCSSADGILSVAWSAAHTDREFASWWEREEASRWHDLQPYVAAWSAAGILRPGLSTTEATDLLWTMTGPAATKSFIADCGWPADRYATFLADMLGQILFHPSDSEDRRMPSGHVARAASKGAEATV